MEMTMNIVDFKSVKLEGILAKIFLSDKKNKPPSWQNKCVHAF